MNQNFHSIIPEIKERIKSECIAETTTDSAEYIAVPYPYVIPGKGRKSALYYWDTYFINIGLIKINITLSYFKLYSKLLNSCCKKISLLLSFF